MNLFQQSNFPPPELSPSAKIYADDCESLTVTFLGELSVLDERMWLTCKQLLFYDQSYSKEAQSNKELRTALESIIQLIEVSKGKKLDTLSQLLIVNLFPLNLLEEEARTELEDITRVALSYYDLLSKMYAYLTGQKPVAIN